MQIKLEVPKNFNDFELLDSGAGFRLERWGDFKLARPDPSIIWDKSIPEIWEDIDAGYRNGDWEIYNSNFPKQWEISFKETKFSLKLSPFKHTGIFAEQAANWSWLMARVDSRQLPVASKNHKTSPDQRNIRVLNLFAYTGAASVVLAKAGCFVTHVDASKPSIGWAKENQALNDLSEDSIRWILDDASKFVKREAKRESFYDGIIMDPPAFGHGPQGNVWKWSQDVPQLLKDCKQILTPNPLFLLINGYATNSSAVGLDNLVSGIFKDTFKTIESGELCLEQKSGQLLSTGIYSRLS